MKKLYFNFIASLCLLFSLSACQSPADFSYADGSSGRYSDFQGKWLVVNYWAAWCKPCREEIPELNKLQQERADIQLIGINYDKPALAILQEQIKEFAIAFPVALAAFDKHYGFAYPQVLPTTVIINPQGIVSAILVGPQTAASLSAAID